MKQAIVNFYGGPGSGKSTMAARLFADLKEQGRNVELVTEYAKDVVWQGSHAVLSNQIYIFGKQQHRLWRLRDKVELIITDAPLLNSIVYNREYSEPLRALVKQEYHQYNNIDIFLTRQKAYNPNGRYQTEEQAKDIDRETLVTLIECTQSSFLKTAGAAGSLSKILDYVERNIKSDKSIL